MSASSRTLGTKTRVIAQILTSFSRVSISEVEALYCLLADALQTRDAGASGARERRPICPVWRKTSPNDRHSTVIGLTGYFQITEICHMLLEQVFREVLGMHVSNKLITASHILEVFIVSCCNNDGRSKCIYKTNYMKGFRAKRDISILDVLHC